MAETLFGIHDDYAGALAKVKKSMAFVHQRQAESMGVVGRLIS